MCLAKSSECFSGPHRHSRGAGHQSRHSRAFVKLSSPIFCHQVLSLPNQQQPLTYSEPISWMLDLSIRETIATCNLPKSESKSPMYLVTQELAAHLDPISRLLQSPRWADRPPLYSHTYNPPRNVLLSVGLWPVCAPSWRAAICPGLWSFSKQCAMKQYPLNRLQKSKT